MSHRGGGDSVAINFNLHRREFRDIELVFDSVDTISVHFVFDSVPIIALLPFLCLLHFFLFLFVVVTIFILFRIANT